MGVVGYRLACQPSRKPSKNWTTGPCIVAAPFDQLQQGAPHRLQSRSLASKVLGMLDSNGFSEAEKLACLSNREPEIVGVGDEAQALDRNAAGNPDSVAPVGRRHNSDRLVLADHPQRHARRLRDLPDVRSAILLKRSELPMTLTEDSAIAAAAMIGESISPNSG